MQIRRRMLLVGVIVVVVVVIGAGAYFLLGGLFEPPVDISGINISSAITAEELLPAHLINGSLNRGTVGETKMWGIRDGVEYTVTEKRARYNGITLRVRKAETEIEATEAFEEYFDDPFEDHFSGFSHKRRMPSCFTFEGGGTSGFVWKSGVWVFGVEAGNDETRNQAAAEWVQQLKGQ